MKSLLIFSLVLITLKLSGQEIPEEVYNNGVMELRSNNFIESEKSFDKAIALGITGKGLKMSYIFRGHALSGQYKFNDAIKSYDKAIEIDSSDLGTFIDRGKTFLPAGNLDKAIQDFDYVIKKDPKGKMAEAAYYYRGRIEFQKSNFELAISYFDKLIELVPTDYEAYFLRGTAKSNMMNVDGSIKDFDEAIKLRPDYMEALANRGVQKLNKLPPKELTKESIDCLDEPCKDFLKAKSLGDTSIEDMVFLYCKKCK